MKNSYIFNKFVRKRDLLSSVLRIVYNKKMLILNSYNLK